MVIQIIFCYVYKQWSSSLRSFSLLFVIPCVSGPVYCLQHLVLKYRP